MKLIFAIMVGMLGLATTIARADPPVDGATIFETRCARCHGDTGKADTSEARALKARPLVNDAELARMTPAEIVSAVKSDLKHQGIVDLNDLTDAELQAAAAFVSELAKGR